MDGMTRLREFAATLEPELRDIAGQIEGEANPAGNVSVSAHDLLPDEEREAIEWVREHGGIDEIREIWNRRSNLRCQLDKEKAKVERQQRHIEFIQRKCRERQERIRDLDKAIAEMRPRLMPEGVEWPRFEDGEPVKPGSEFGYGTRLDAQEVTSILFTSEGCFIEPDYSWECDDYALCVDYALMVKQGQRVKRPAPKALDSEGVECNVGDAVWWVHNETGNFRIIRIDKYGKCAIHDDDPDEPCGMTVPSTELTHKRPVFDADGVEIREKLDVWWICEDDERGVHAERLRVETIGPDGLIECSPYNGGTWVYLEPSELHVKEPVLDADGVEIREGDTVYHVKDGSEMTVYGIEGEWLVVSVGGRVRHDIVTHRVPVLAADGRPLRVGETVYHVNTGIEYSVRSVTNGGAHLSKGDKPGGYCRADYLTHERPETRQSIVDEIGEEMAKRIDAIVSAGRWN